MTFKNLFIDAIHNTVKVEIEFNSKSKGRIKRTCIPFDYGKSNKPNAKDLSDKYHVYDLDSPDGRHILSIDPSQIINIIPLDEKFQPANYINWSPMNWHISRDWGLYS